MITKGQIEHKFTQLADELGLHVQYIKDENKVHQEYIEVHDLNNLLNRICQELVEMAEDNQTKEL